MVYEFVFPTHKIKYIMICSIKVIVVLFFGMFQFTIFLNTFLFMKYLFSGYSGTYSCLRLFHVKFIN